MFLFKGQACLELRAGRVEVSNGLIFPYITLKVSAFVVRDDRDIVSMYFGSSLLGCKKSVTINTVAVLADMVLHRKVGEMSELL